MTVIGTAASMGRSKYYRMIVDGVGFEHGGLWVREPGGWVWVPGECVNAYIAITGRAAAAHSSGAPAPEEEP